MFLSIIIPVYNVEKYLKQCVDSILSQNLTDYEIILVDDGSPDGSGVICDEYVSKNSCISVIHKTNGGLSSARNAGIDMAQGDYIIFMDSDDWWNENVSVLGVLEQVKQSPKTEMFLFTSLDYVEGKGLFKRDEHTRLSLVPTDCVEAYYKGLLNNGNLEVSAATKILKKEFLIKNNLYFQQGITSEDNEWILRLLRCLNDVKIINEPLYICRMGRVGSITNSIKKKNIVDLLNIINKSIEYYKENDNVTLKKYELCYCSYLWFSALGLSRKLNSSERKELRSLFNKTKEVCKYSNSSKTKLCLRVYKALGYEVTGFVLGIYLWLKGKLPINKKVVES